MATQKKFTLQIYAATNEMQIIWDRSSDSRPAAEDLENLIDLTKRAVGNLERLRDEWRLVGSPQPLPIVRLK